MSRNRYNRKILLHTLNPSPPPSASLDTTTAQLNKGLSTTNIIPRDRYYGDLQWYAPDGVNGDKKDTLLIIAVKTNNLKLVEWILSLDGLDTTKQNGKGLNAMAVAKAIGREDLLLGMLTSAASPGASGSTATGAAGVGTSTDPGVPPPPPSQAAAEEAAKETSRLANAIKMLKVKRVLGSECGSKAFFQRLLHG